MSQERFNLIHHKDFHNLQLQNYSVKERAVFLALCLKVMEQENEVVTFKISELVKIANYTPRKKGDNIYTFLKELSDKLLKVQVMQIRKDEGFTNMVLFPTFSVDEKEKVVRIRINPDYKYLLNHLQAPYTIQALIEYSNLKSGYSQLMYSILKKWNKTKKVNITLEDFRRELGVPESYDASVINKRVLPPIMKELPQYFEGLKIKKIKEGKFISAFEFTWKENKEEYVAFEEEVEISEELLSAIEKAKRNRFVKPILTDDNIITLLDKFSEDKLIKGLKDIYNVVTKEISSINYLIKIIEGDPDKPKRKLVLKRNKKEFEKIKEAEIIEEEPFNVEKVYYFWKNKFDGSNIDEVLEGFLLEIPSSVADDEKIIKYYKMLLELKKRGE